MNEKRIEALPSVHEVLCALVGPWRGTGSGRFPTIDSFRYREELEFTAHATKPHLHYEQRTWLTSDGADDGQPSHWESGFVLVQEDGAIELLNAQESGRVEVLVGGLYAHDGGTHQLRLSSVVHAHDPRVLVTSRVLTFGNDELAYEVQMATDQVAECQVHLQARLLRA